MQHLVTNLCVLLIFRFFLPITLENVPKIEISQDSIGSCENVDEIKCHDQGNVQNSNIYTSLSKDILKEQDLNNRDYHKLENLYKYENLQKATESFSCKHCGKNFDFSKI